MLRSIWAAVDAIALDSSSSTCSIHMIKWNKCFKITMMVVDS